MARNATASLRLPGRSTLLAVMVSTSAIAVQATDFQKGDVFVGVRNGIYQRYTNDGILLESLDTGRGGEPTGCAFDDQGRLVGTAFSTNRVVVFEPTHPHAITADFPTEGLTSPPESGNESVRFDGTGHFWIGHADGGHALHRYDSAYTLVEELTPVTDRGTDWIDLAADGCTMFYASEGSVIRRFDICTQLQLPDFATVSSPPVYALRLLPPGDGTGGLLVANGSQVLRLDGSGSTVQVYSATGISSWFALNLDPNGTSFWSADIGGTATFTRFNIATGQIEVGPVSTGAASVTGLCVYGELLAGSCEDNQAVAIARAPSPVCAGTRVTLDGSSSLACAAAGLEYRWNDGTTDVCPWSTSPTCEVTVNQTTTFTLTVSCRDNNYCKDDTQILIEVTTGPVASLAPLPDICPGEPVHLDASASQPGGCSGALEYQFRDGTGIIRAWSTDPRHGPLNPAATTTYTVEVRCALVPDCITTSEQTVTVVPGQRPPDLGNTLLQVDRASDVIASWGGVPEASSYRLYRETQKGSWTLPPYRDALPTPDSTVPDVPWPPRLYYYRVSGVACGGLEGP